MSNKNIKVFLSILSLSLALIASSGCAGLSESDDELATKGERMPVHKALDRYYDALNAMLQGDPKPARDVWWQDDTIVYMGGDGAYNVGWDEVYANWQKQAAMKLGVKVEMENVRIDVSGDIAITHQMSIGRNPGNAKIQPPALRATSVLEKRNGQWKMISHHVDAIGELKDK